MPITPDSESFSFTYFALYWMVSGVAVLVTSKIVSGFRVSGFFTAVIAALAVAAANAVLWPVLFVLTLPLTLITLGLFLFILNGAVLKICAALLPGFQIESWWAAIFGSIVLSIMSSLLHYLLI